MRDDLLALLALVGEALGARLAEAGAVAPALAVDHELLAVLRAHAEAGRLEAERDAEGLGRDRRRALAVVDDDIAHEAGARPRDRLDARDRRDDAERRE